MPRPRSIPKRTRHNSGLAVVRLNGRDHYLGEYDSPASVEHYERLVGEWLAQGRQLPTPSGRERQDLTVNEVILRFLIWAESYFGSSKEGSHEQSNLKHALRPLKALYGSTPASAFGPRSLKAIREHMIAVQDLSRREVNKRIGRIKRMFKWAASEELVSPTVFHGLQSVEGLREGRTNARETDPVQPVDDAIIEQTLPFLPPPVRAVVQLQRLTGARPSEILIARPADFRTDTDPWIYTPRSHKTKRRGFRREVPVGPKAQAILAAFVVRDPEAYLFSPIEAHAWYYEQREGKPAPKAASGRRKTGRMRDHYDRDSYRRAIEYAIGKANKAGVEIPHWFPYQIRHTMGTDVRNRYGVEAAQVSLGHARADVTQVYAERNLALAVKVARECG